MTATDQMIAAAAKVLRKFDDEAYGESGPVSAYHDDAEAILNAALAAMPSTPPATEFDGQFDEPSTPPAAQPVAGFEVGDLKDQRARLVAQGIDPNLNHLPSPDVRWIEWLGGDFLPVPPEMRVTVLLRDGTIEGPTVAREFGGEDSCWKHRGSSGDIVAYTSDVLFTQPAAQPVAVPVTLTYTNWRGETAERTIIPQGIWFGSTDWHPEPQWLLKAIDTEKGAERDFALKDFTTPPADGWFSRSG